MSTALAQEVAAVEAQLARADGKAALLIGLTGAAAVAAPGVITGAHLSAVAAVPGWLAAAAMVGAAGLLLAGVRPALGGGHGFVRYARMSPAQLLQDVDALAGPEESARRLADLSRIAVAKYVRIRLAVDLALVGLALGVAATIAGWAA
ncbi:Pycsar system effector family protein [Micromonospora nigra]|uniref:Pycsar system effector family protein n=1 Tax=Micromonospora nigra TaxID=145857 RepID=UPI001112E3F7|nr:Pycsar system effector family protein [Micromonospora nigra]